MSKVCSKYKSNLVTIVSYIVKNPKDIAFAYAINLPMDTHLILSDSQLFDDYMLDVKANYDEYKYLFVVGDGFNDSNPLRAEILLKLIMQRRTNNLYTIVIFQRVPGQIGGRPKALKSQDTDTNLIDIIGKSCLCLLDSDKDVSLIQERNKQKLQDAESEGYNS